MSDERSYIMIKRGLIGEIIGRFEKRGYQLRALKIKNVERSLAEAHYSDLSSKPFFSALVDYIISGPVVCMVWEGKNIVSVGRMMIGATKPEASAPGTIRGDLAIEVGRNVIHGSDTVENAGEETLSAIGKEIALWFPDGITEWTPVAKPWIYE